MTTQVRWTWVHALQTERKKSFAKLDFARFHPPCFFWNLVIEDDNPSSHLLTRLTQQLQFAPAQNQLNPLTV